MRGFSLFAPMLGTILVLVALSTAAFMWQQESKVRSEIDVMEAKVLLNAMPEQLKWDAISTYVLALRQWFYRSYVHSLGAMSHPPKDDIAKTMLSYIGTDSDSPWFQLGNIKYRYYVENDATKISRIMDVRVPDNEKVYIEIDPSRGTPPLFNIEMNTGASGGVEQIRTWLFDSKTGFPVYYPVKEIDDKIKGIQNTARSTYFIAGILPESKNQGNRAVAVVGGVVDPIGKYDTPNDLLKPAKDAYSLWPEKKEDAKEFGKSGMIFNALERWLNSQGAELIQINRVDVEAEEGIPYYRLICVKGDLAELITGKADPVCVKVEKGEEPYELEGDKVPYAKIKSVEAEFVVTAASHCAPSAHSTVRARVSAELSFGGSESVPSSGEVEKANRNNDVVEGYVTVNSSSDGACCPSGSTCPPYSLKYVCDMDTAKETAIENCAKQCETKSNYFLSYDECEEFCVSKMNIPSNNSKCGATPDCGEVTWEYTMKELAEKVLKKIENEVSGDSNGNKDEKAKYLLKLFTDKALKEDEDIYRPEVDSIALLSVTVLNPTASGGSIDIDSTGAEVKVCVTSDGCP